MKQNKIIVCCMLLAMISCNNDNSLPNPEVMCTDLTTKDDGKEYFNDKSFTGSCYTLYGQDVDQIDEIRSYKKGIRHGVWAKYHSNGNLFYKSSSKRGEIDGLYSSYHINGNRADKGKLNKGYKDGVWEYYDINGILYLKEFYKNKMRIDEEKY